MFRKDICFFLPLFFIPSFPALFPPKVASRKYLTGRPKSPRFAGHCDSLKGFHGVLFSLLSLLLYTAFLTWRARIVFSFSSPFLSPNKFMLSFFIAAPELLPFAFYWGPGKLVIDLGPKTNPLSPLGFGFT